MFEKNDMFGSFEILGSLGRGGMGEVFKVRQVHLDKLLALKILPKHFADEPERRERFQREIQATAKMEHEGIVMVYDAGVIDGYPYYTMDLLEGGTLTDKIRTGIDEREALKIALKVSQALEHAHRHGLVHRDLKPENILFNRLNCPVIVDFGIVKLQNSDLTDVNHSLGTANYMSPEQFNGDSDHRADLYALGVILYRMLTKQYVFTATNTMSLIGKHLSEPPPDLPAKFSHLQPIVSTLLEKNPNNRYQTAEQLSLDLNATMNGLPYTKTSVASAQEPPYQSEGLTEVNNNSLASKPSVPEKSQSPRSSLLKLWPAASLLLMLCLVGIFSFSALSDKREGVTKSASSGSKEGTSEGESDTTGVNSSKAVALLKGRAILQLLSQPEGASVYFNGAFIGLTPIVSEGLPSGAGEIVVSKRFFESKTIDVALGEKSVTKLSVSLARGYGSLTLDSEPSGATVTIDGKLVDEKTPLTIENIAAGEHTLNVQHDNLYYTGKYVIEHGDLAVFRPSLEPGQLVAIGDSWVRPERALLVAVDRIKSGQLFTPKGADALSLLSKLTEFRETSDAARRSINDLFAATVKWVDTAIGDGDFDEAKTRLSVVKKYFDGRDEIVALEKRLTDAQAAEVKSSQVAYIKSLEKRIASYLARDQFMAAFTELDKADSLILSEGSAGELRQVIEQAQSQFKRTVERYSGRMLLISTGSSSALKPYLLGESEVTVGLWLQCVSDAVCSKPDGLEDTSENYPVTQVSYSDVTEQFIPWLNQKTKRTFKLPTRAQWEYGALGGGRQTFYWGGAPSGKFANGAQKYGWPEDGYLKAAPIRSYSANGFGLHDTIGNVSEWTDDCADAIQNQRCLRRFSLGGSWFSAIKYLEPRTALALIATSRASDQGFRIAQEIP